MKPNLRTALVVALVAAMAAIGHFSAQPLKPAQPAEPDPAKWVVQPKEWVPYRYEVSLAVDGVPIGSTFEAYQGDDGSTRIDSISPQATKVVIDNRRLGRHFEWTKGGKGTAYPLRQRPFGGKPATVIEKSNARSVPPTDPRVSQLATLHPHLTFWEFRSRDGKTVTVFCPELNLLPVHVSFGNGQTKTVRNVVLGPVPATVFDPDQHIELAESTEARGAGSVTELPSATLRRGQK